MIFKFLFIVCVSCFLPKQCQSNNILNHLEPCKKLTPDCLKKFVQKALPTIAGGVPDLGIISLDPFVVERLEMVLPGGLKIVFYDGHSTGLKKCRVDSASMHTDTLHIDLHCDFLIKGKYQSSGKLLLFSIDGEGESVIRCKNVKIQHKLHLGTRTGADGESYFELKKLTGVHTFDGPVSYNMSNLFKNNPEMTKLVLDFINTNWKLVAEELGKPIVDYVLVYVEKNYKKFFDAIPISNLMDL